jgi:TatD DNase family protein
VTAFIDTHAHIHSDFDAADDAIARAREAGVSTIVTLGVTLDDSRAAIALAARREGVVAAAGVHPHDAKDASDDDLAALGQLAADPSVRLIGEIGLDFYRNLSSREDQRRVLSRQLEIAATADKPVAVHARDAHDEMHPLLEAWSRTVGGALSGGRPIGVMHYFSADLALALRYIELGFVISIHTSVTHPKAEMLQQVAREAPLESLVVETDSPYGAPQRYRGKRNEPAYVVEAASKIAELRGVGIEAVASATTENALRLLG